MNFEQDIICPECCNVQLLGLNFNEESNDINNFIDLYSFCIFNHKRLKPCLQKNNFNYIFNSKEYNNIIYNKDLKCENCNKKPFEYHCFECKRNICSKCFDYHKTHRYYYNYGYISEKELEEINNNLQRAKNNADLFMKIIKSFIIKYEMELNELRLLFKQYKDINDKLISFSEYILQKYNELLKIQKPIYYPLYFNVKNILQFEFLPIKIPLEDISIKKFTDILTKKITSGYYFPISNSTLTSNLEDYNKPNPFKSYFDIKTLDDFTKKEIEYDEIYSYGENKFCGINYNFIEINGNQNDTKKEKEEGMEIYNIKNQMVETKIKTTPDYIHCSEKYNIIILSYEEYIEIYNLKDFSLIQEIFYDETRQSVKRQGTTLWNPNMTNKYHDFSDIIFISENSIGFIYEGHLAYLGEDVENLFEYDNIEVINVTNDRCDYDFDDYCYFIVYHRENKNGIFIPKTVSLLVKKDIKIDEISLKVGKYTGNDEDSSYCLFEHDSTTQISDEGFIIAFKSRIQVGRNHKKYYITDKFYKNETIYYFLNSKENRYVKSIIGKTKEKSYLFKNDLDEQFYFLYNESNNTAKTLKKYFEKCNLNLTVIYIKGNLNIREVYIEKNNIIGVNYNSIYVGKIVSGELEIINYFYLPESEFLKHISLKYKCIYYKNQNNNFREYDSIIIEDN